MVNVSVRGQMRAEGGCSRADRGAHPGKPSPTDNPQVAAALIEIIQPREQFNHWRSDEKGFKGSGD